MESRYRQFLTEMKLPPQTIIRFYNHLPVLFRGLSLLYTMIFSLVGTFLLYDHGSLVKISSISHRNDTSASDDYKILLSSIVISGFPILLHLFGLWILTIHYSFIHRWMGDASLKKIRCFFYIIGVILLILPVAYLAYNLWVMFVALIVAFLLAFLFTPIFTTFSPKISC